MPAEVAHTIQRPMRAPAVSSTPASSPFRKLAWVLPNMAARRNTPAPAPLAAASRRLVLSHPALAVAVAALAATMLRRLLRQ